MKSSPAIAYIAAIFVAFAATFVAYAPSSLASVPCSVDGSSGKQGVLVHGVCYVVDPTEGSGNSTPSVITKTIACGSAVSLASEGWNPECGPPQSCTSIDPLTHKSIVRTAFATLTLINGKWRNPVVWCPGVAAPAVTMADIQEQAIRLLPHVAIGSAWTTTALVQAETVLWAGTDADRSLGAVRIVGRTVHLRIAFDHAAWDFGDGSTDTVTSPGKAYDKTGDPCRSAQCADYYGHTYERTGPMTISLTVTWRAQFSFDNANWTDIPQAITGPTAQHTITLKQARGILVPPPNP